MSVQFARKHKLKIPAPNKYQTLPLKVKCYVDEDGNVYKMEDDEEVGLILGEYKDGIFFVC